MPMPGVKLQSPIRDLIPIKSSAGPSQGKGKGRAVKAMDEGKSKRERLISLTMSKFEGVFHGGSLAFMYNWINNEHGDSSLEGPRESVDDWLTDHTGGKGWCPDPVHHKYIARKWTKDLANTHPEYSKDIQNFPSQFN
jgi:hypothetical protein